MNLSEIFRTLLDAYNSQGWWPVSNLDRPIGEKDKDFINYVKFNPKGKKDDFVKNWPRHLGLLPTDDAKKFEIIVGAILTQNTNWSNVEKAVYSINCHNFMNVKKIKNVKHDKLASFIRSAGYYNQKAERLKMIASNLDLFVSIDAFFNQKDVRKKLLDMNGIGPETADSILLYSAGLPFFVVDAYTKRLFSRLGFCKEDVDYHELQSFIAGSLRTDPVLFKEFHALIVEHAKRHCKVEPVCENCPLGQICLFKR